MKSRYKPKQIELPDEGSHTGVIATVEYQPNVKTNFGVKNRVRFGIDTDQEGEDREPIRVFVRYNDTLHSSSDLYSFIVKMTGEAPETGYDFDELLGTEVEFEIQHDESADKRTWPNVYDLHRKRTPKEKAADKRSEERVKRALSDIRKQAQKPKPADGTEPEEPKAKSTKSQWQGKKKTTAEPVAVAEADDRPLFDNQEDDIPFEPHEEDVPA
jgi:hypothetical protein